MGDMESPVMSRETMTSEALLYQVAIERLVKKISSLPKERRQDLRELLDDINGTSNDAERNEIARTMMEIVMPEIIGTLVMDAPQRKTDGTFLRARSEWIGERIRQLRERRGWTQTDLADASGLPQSHISRLEVGKHSPSNVTLKKIAKALKIDVHALDYEEHD